MPTTTTAQGLRAIATIGANYIGITHKYSYQAHVCSTSHHI
jgi:hypothetical protein